MHTGPARGVLVQGHRSVPTFMVGMAGINTWEIQTQLTAVSTYGACAASQGWGALPIAFPVNITSCNGNGTRPIRKTPWRHDYYIFPLCKKAPGNVGWLDLNGRKQAGLPIRSFTQQHTPRFANVVEPPNYREPKLQAD